MGAILDVREDPEFLLLYSSFLLNSTQFSLKYDLKEGFLRTQRTPGFTTGMQWMGESLGHDKKSTISLEMFGDTVVQV